MELGLPHDLTLYRILTDWGSLIGGGFALMAGFIAYGAGRTQAKATRQAAEMQIKAEHQKLVQEIQIVRKSLAIELRQVVGQAFNAHKQLKRVIMQTSGPITARMIESSFGIPVPIVYPAVADRIAFLGDEAMGVVIIYQLIEIAREGAGQLIRHRTPDDLPIANIGLVSDIFLNACAQARDVLPRLKTGVDSHDEKDDKLIAMINEATSAWDASRQQQAAKQ